MGAVRNKFHVLAKHPIQLLMDGVYTFFGGLAVLAFSNHINKSITTTKLVAPKSGFYYELYHYVSIYLQHFLLWMEHTISIGNGSVIAIIVLTLIIRLAILPLTLINSRNAVLHREQKKALLPQMQLIDDIMLNVPVTNSQRRQLLQLKRKCYKENNVHNTEWMVYVSVIVQMIVLSCLYQAVAYSPELAKTTILGISLAKRSFALAAMAAVMYFLEQVVMILGMTKEERAVLPLSTYWLTPVSIFCSAFFLPSILDIYWLTSAGFLLVQNYINYWIMRPYLTKKTKTQFVPEEIITDEAIDKIINN